MSLFLSILSLCFWLTPFQSAAATQPTPATLTPGQTVEREIAPGEMHAYEINLEADKLVQFISEHAGLLGSLKLLDAEGQTLNMMDNTLATGRLRVQALVARAGRYRIEFRAFRNQAAGRYQLRWTEHRAPSENERVKLAIELWRQTSVSHTRKGEYAEAFAASERALALGRQLRPEAPEVLLDLLNRVGDLASEVGEFARAERAWLEAIPLAEQQVGLGSTPLADGLSGLANLYIEYGGDYVVAANHLQRALAIYEKALGPQHAYVANTLNSLGNVYFVARQYEQAEPIYQRSLALFEKQMPDNQSSAYPLTMLGRIAHGRGEYAAAAAYLQRALTLQEKANGSEHEGTALIIIALGKLAQERGQWAAATDFYQRAYQIFARTHGSQHLDTIEALEALAQVKLAQNDMSAALPFQTQALKATQLSLRALLTSGSEPQRRAFLALYGHQTDALLSWHLRLAPNDQTVQELAVTTLLQRKGLVQETLANTFANLRRRVDATGQKTLEQWQGITAQLARLVLDGPRASAAEYQSQLDALTQQRDQLENELSRLSAGSFQPARAVTLDEMQRAIPANAALLEFAVYRPFDPKAATAGEQYGAPRYAVYVIRPTGAVTWRELGDAASLDSAINVWRAALREPKRADLTKAGSAVSARLWQPLQPLLAGAQHLLISPDGALNLIPFEALPTTTGKYLVERYAISYLTSGRDLLRLQQNLPAALAGTSAPNVPLVIADPLFGEPGALANLPAQTIAQTIAKAGRLQRRRSVTTGNALNEVYFAPLFGTAQEARTIKTLFSDATLLTGAAATEAALKQVNAPRLLHIATHGFFLADTAQRPTASVNPLLRSGLALAQANLRQQQTTGEDGILTALEAAGLNLWGTRLVTLSACDTGLGEVRNGEGVYGLRRAFALAGAETLVMSLWPVSDVVTRELMTAYYTGLRNGQGRGAALRAAQLPMLKRPDRRAPYYWASFIQAGEWGNLNGQR